jgi:hypothetical protein
LSGKRSGEALLVEVLSGEKEAGGGSGIARSESDEIWRRMLGI